MDKDRMEQGDSGVVPIQPGEILGLTYVIMIMSRMYFDYGMCNIL